MDKSDFAALVRNPILHRADFQLRLMRLVTDPRYYCDALAGVFPGDNPIREALDEQFEKSKSGLEKMFIAMCEHKESIKEVEKGVLKMEDAEARFADLGMDLGFASAGRKQLKRLRQDKKRMFEGLDNSLDGIEQLGFIRSYAEGLYRTDGTPSPSEMVDLLHLVYHTEVNLIRTDRRIAEILKTDPQLSGKIIPKLRHLPDAIEKAAAQSPT